MEKSDPDSDDGDSPFGDVALSFFRTPAANSFENLSPQLDRDDDDSMLIFSSGRAASSSQPSSSSLQHPAPPTLSRETELDSDEESLPTLDLSEERAVVAAGQFRNNHGGGGGGWINGMSEFLTDLVGSIRYNLGLTEAGVQPLTHEASDESDDEEAAPDTVFEVPNSPPGGPPPVVLAPNGRRAARLHTKVLRPCPINIVAASIRFTPQTPCPSADSEPANFEVLLTGEGDASRRSDDNDDDDEEEEEEDSNTHSGEENARATSAGEQQAGSAARLAERIGSAPVWLLKFDYDASVECELSVELGGQPDSEPSAPVACVVLQPGFGESVSIAVPAARLSALPSFQSTPPSYAALTLTATPKSAVGLPPSPSPPPATSASTTASSTAAEQPGADIDQYSAVCSLVQSSSDNVGVRVDRLTIRSNAVIYVLSEIFGVPAHANDDTATSSTRDCVVCLSDPASTFPIPCRHCCLCVNCADLFRQQSNKCPICRSPLRSLIQIAPPKATCK